MPNELGLTLNLQISTARREALVETQIDLLNPDLDLPSYVKLLKSLYGFYAPVEAAIAQSGLPWYFGAWHPLLRTKWLKADLAYFDIPLSRARVNESVPLRLSTADAFGWQYAIEALSSMETHTVRHLGPKLSLGRTNGMRFLCNDGDFNNRNWQRFGGVLNNYHQSHPDCCETVTSGANEAFSLLMKWLLKTVPQYPVLTA